MRILAFGGSLREASFNRALLAEAAALAPPGTELDLDILPVIGSLPLFDQDVAERDFPIKGRGAQGRAAGGGRPAHRHARVQLGDPGLPQERARLGLPPSG